MRLYFALVCGGKITTEPSSGPDFKDFGRVPNWILVNITSPTAITWEMNLQLHRNGVTANTQNNTALFTVHWNVVRSRPEQAQNQYEDVHIVICRSLFP